MVIDGQRLREIRETEAAINDGIEISVPGDPRMWAFAFGVAMFALGGIGFFTAPYSYDRLSYDQRWANTRLVERLPGEINAYIDLSGDVTSIEATVTDGVRYIDLVVSGPLKLDHQSGDVTFLNPETRESDVYRDYKSSGQRAADAVPDLDSGISKDWKIAKSFVGMLEGAARWTAGAAGSAANGEFFADMQFPGQAKQAVWSLPLIKIPDADRAIIVRGSIESVSLINGKIMVDLSFWEFGFLTALSMIAAVVGLALVAVLFYNPAFLSE